MELPWVTPDVPEVPDPSGAILGDLAAQLTSPKVATSLSNSLQSGMSEAFFPSRDLIPAPADETLGEGCALLLQRGIRESWECSHGSERRDNFL